MPNVDDPAFEPRDHPGFSARRARLGYELGCERLGISAWEIDPGQAAYPYHAHLTEEELVIVQRGTPSLRTPEGWRELAEGEVVRFPRGEAGAHQLVNRTSEPVRFLAVSTNGDPDIVLYPDSGKVGAAERNPDGSGFWKFFRMDDAVEYWHGETPPELPD